MRSVGNDIVSMYYSILDQRRAETPEDDCECTNPIGVRDLPLTVYVLNKIVHYAQKKVILM